MGVAQRQIVEIARSLVQRSTLLILDEPSAVLGRHDLQQLFQVLQALRSEGVSILYISHRLEEIFEKGIVEEGVQAKSAEETRAFWKSRESISEALRSHGQLHTSDISVPIKSRKSFIEEWEAIFARKYSDW